MCEDEKNRFMEIKKETNVIGERINNVNQYQRIIDYNLGKDKIKNEEEKEINMKLKQDIDLVEKVNMTQKRKNENLDKIILEKEKEVEELKNKLIQLKRLNKKENSLYQNDIQLQIEKAKEEAEAQKNREKKCIEIIYCLYLIQNYFINEEHFDREYMQSSNEYRLLYNNKLDIALNKKSKKELKNAKLDDNNIKEEKEVKEEKGENDNNNFNKGKINLSKISSFKFLHNPLVSLDNEDGEPNIEIRRPNSTKNK